MATFHLRPLVGPRRDPKRNRLKASPLFGDSSPDEIARLAVLLDEAELPSGHVLMKEGTPGREVFVIREGYALVTLRGSPVAVLGPGEVVGEMSALDHQPRSATVIAQTPMRVFVTGPLELAAMIDTSPALRRKLLTMLSERVRSVEHPQEHRTAL